MVAADAVAALVLATLHVVAARLRFLDRVPRSRLLSAAGGVSVAYVFVHVLPELAGHQQMVGAGLVGELGGIVGQQAYVLALLGLVVFYGLERHAVRSRLRQRHHGEDATEGHVAWLTIGSYAMYNALIGSALPERGGIPELALYTVALGVHFVVVDHGLREHHGRAYREWGRWICGAAVLAGWSVSVAVGVPEEVRAASLSFLAGGVVMNVLKEELPEQRESQLLPFVLGAGGYTLLLLLI